MSYDFQIFTKLKTSDEDIKQFAKRERGLIIGGKIDESCTLSRDTNGKELVLMVISYPEEIDFDVVPEVVAETGSHLEWTLEINVHAGAPSDAVEVALRLATCLAEKGDGIAFDPQAEEVLFPKTGIASTPAAEKATPKAKQAFTINLVTFDFCFAPSALNNESPKLLVALLKKYFPDAMPWRLKALGASALKLKKDDMESFVACWNDTLKEPYGGHLTWDGVSPGNSGVVNFFDPRKGGRFKTTDVRLSFNATSIEDDAIASKAIVELFCSIAKELRPFYGAAFVEEGFELKGHSLAYTQTTKTYRLHERAWKGIPNQPTWLSWIGAEYAASVADKIEKSDAVRENGKDGILIVLGEKPVHIDEFGDQFPNLPEEYLQFSGMVADHLTGGLMPGFIAAKIIPETVYQ